VAVFVLPCRVGAGLQQQLQHLHVALVALGRVDQGRVALWRETWWKNGVLPWKNGVLPWKNGVLPCKNGGT